MIGDPVTGPGTGYLVFEHSCTMLRLVHICQVANSLSALNPISNYCRNLWNRRYDKKTFLVFAQMLKRFVWKLDIKFTLIQIRQELWSSGYGRRLMCQRS